MARARLQAKLLRVLEEREFERIGGNTSIKIDTRIIASSNDNIEHLVNIGSFRRDLYFRLNVLPLEIPTLAERSDEDNINEDTSYEEIVKDAVLKIDNLPRETALEIKPTEAFPSENIGSIDVGENDKPLFYVMAVKKSMFETGLFSGWIYNSDESSNSLPWWSKWLYDHGYQYKIDKTILEEYLMGNYSFELGNQGILVLDLETIAKIQEQYNKQDTIDRNRNIRSIFMLFGAILIGYSVIMLLAWVLDTNVDLGFNILEKMTLGHLIAVTDESEVPVYDMEDRKYIGFGNLVIQSCIVAVIGIVLILVDFYEIAYWLIKIFGGIAQFVLKAIFQ